MSEPRRAVHNTFVIERVYDASPARVFAAFAQPEAKARWFQPPEGWRVEQQTLDFRVGGVETSIGGPPDGATISYVATFQDIVPRERIVYTYDMHIDGKRISVSLTTVEFHPEGQRTKLIYTEQGVFLDGHADGAASREGGTRAALEKLGRSLG